MADSRQSEVLKQIASAWEAAQRQLGALREQVERATALAQAKVQSNWLLRDEDRALRDLGEAVWKEVRAGRLNLPPSLDQALRVVSRIEGKKESQNEQLTMMLLDAAKDLDGTAASPATSKAQAPPRKEPVAPRRKIR